MSKELIEKQIRYKIMTNFLKIQEVTLIDQKDEECLFGQLEMNKPIYIMGNPIKIRYEDFKKQIEKNFFEENETYFRIVYLWAEGLLDSKQGRTEEGQRKMEDAVRIFEIIGCSKSADYYRSAIEC